MLGKRRSSSRAAPDKNSGRRLAYTDSVMALVVCPSIPLISRIGTPAAASSPECPCCGVPRVAFPVGTSRRTRLACLVACATSAVCTHRSFFPSAPRLGIRVDVRDKLVVTDHQPTTQPHTAKLAFPDLSNHRASMHSQPSRGVINGVQDRHPHLRAHRTFGQAPLGATVLALVRVRRRIRARTVG